MELKLSFIIFAWFVMIGLVSCENPNCNFSTFDVQSEFNITKYLGKWYEMKWLSQNYIPEDQLFQDYAHNYVMESNGTITAYIKGRDPTKPDNCFRYSAWISQTNTPGKLKYRRWTSGEGSAQITSDYWVMMTDYDNYAFVYGCRVPFENGTCNEPDSWVWSRTQSLPESTMNLITKKMEEVCVDPTKYLATRQNNECPECRYKLTEVVKNFDVQKYLGKWYEMKWLAQNYIPEDQLFQDYAHNYVMESNGTITAYIKGRDPTTPDKCFRYSAWITQTNTPGKLRYRRWASSDRSAQITSDYWVLMTDYINYAFVYGCRVPFENGTCNEPDSWIWSRTQSLPESTMNLITKKMEEVCVDPTKYLATRQNNECPECRYKLTEVVKSFDVQKYTGNWYQLRIYKPNAKIGFTPKNTIHSLTVRDNTGLDFTITNRDNNGKCFTKNAFLRKIKSSAKLILEINKENQGLKLDYWVMGTDYVSYSVVYSCLVPGANLTCSQAEVIVFGRKKSLSASDWEMVKKKVINVCLDPMDYIDINDSRVSDCSTSGSRQIGHQNEVTCLIAFLFIIIWKISSDISSA